jgi:hypothetical protein
MNTTPEYTSEMGYAAQRYIDSLCHTSNGERIMHTPSMPGGFYWYELYEAMINAARERSH